MRHRRGLAHQLRHGSHPSMNRRAEISRPVNGAEKISELSMMRPVQRAPDFSPGIHARVRCGAPFLAGKAHRWCLFLLATAVLCTAVPASHAQPQPDPPVAPISSVPPESLWTCGMHPQVIRTEPGPCPICGMSLTPLKSRERGATAPPTERKVRYWWDPMMSPPYISDRPGKSPMGMDLVPVYDDEVSAGPAVVIDPTMVQNMGVRIATVTEGPLRTTIRAAGYLNEAQPNQRDINLRVSGWIEHLYADTEGMHLNEGAPLFDLYSPELQLGIDELIAARRLRGTTGESGEGRASAVDTVYYAAERKLQLYGLPQSEVDRLARLQRAPAAVTFHSPVTGHLTEKTVVDGSAVMAGDRVMRIVDHGLLWLDAQVYEPQLPFIRLGQPVSATVVGVPGQRFTGDVAFIHPHVEAMTRTAMVRIAVKNESLALRPGMYATVDITSELTPRTLLVPREAVIDTGTRQVAFVALEHGHFDPRLVTVGSAGDDGLVQVLSGLAPGERVVISGQFLLDAESRFREAIQKFLATKTLSHSTGPEATHDPHHH